MTMENINQSFSWNRKFNPLILSHNRVLLLGEKEQLMLPEIQSPELFQSWDQSFSLEDLLAKDTDWQSQATMVYSFNQWCKNGILAESSAIQPRYHQPNWSKTAKTVPLKDGVGQLVLLTEFPRPVFLDWIQRTAFPKSMDIVVVDDYLDPRLEAINRTHLEMGKNWLLIKPNGDQPLIGPLFHPQQEHTPCWKCMAKRLLHNQPVRRMLRQQELNWKVPIRYDQKQVEAVLGQVPQIFSLFHESTPEKVLLEVNLQNMDLQEHWVSHRPQCHQCGDSNYSSRQGEKPLVLSPTFKQYVRDGGVRCCPPEETLERLRKCISPLTGVINELQKVPNQNDDGILIFQSSFFKTPPSHRIPCNADLVQYSLGKGISHEQSQAGALAESIERYAVQFQGDEPRIFSSFSQLLSPAIHPRLLSQYSELQKSKRVDYHDAIPIHWIRAWSLTNNNPCYLPFNYCFANPPFGEENYCTFNSNGCSAGNSLEEAILQGFFELIERDATAIWWYNRISRPAVGLESLPQKSLEKIDKTLSKDWDYWVLDLTHDFQIPVMAAVALNKKDHSYRLGFGCHFDPVLATQRALTEICQIVAIGFQNSSKFDFRDIVPHPFLHPDEKGSSTPIDAFPVVDHEDIRDDILFCVAQVQKQHLEVLVLDYSRADLPLHTVKVVVPGLCHIWPQLGSSRLYDVPMSMEWTAQKNKEQDLNPQALFI